MLKVFARSFLAACVLFSTAAHATWPDRAVTLIVPYAAGGITDVLARLTAELLQRKFKQSFIVQNETGAGGIIGAANAARAKPDGYTLFFAPIALLTLSPLTTKVNLRPAISNRSRSWLQSVRGDRRQGFSRQHDFGVHR